MRDGRDSRPDRLVAAETVLAGIPDDLSSGMPASVNVSETIRQKQLFRLQPCGRIVLAPATGARPITAVTAIIAAMTIFLMRIFSTSWITTGPE